MRKTGRLIVALAGNPSQSQTSDAYDRLAAEFPDLEVTVLSGVTQVLHVPGELEVYPKEDQ